MNRFLYILFCIFLTGMLVSAAVCLLLFVIRCDMLKGIRGNIFAVCAAGTLLCAFLSNQVDRINKKNGG